MQYFIREFDPELPWQSAEAVRTVLDDMEADAATDLWNRWLRQYWDERVLGRPVSLDQRELSDMARWPLHLGMVFPDAVALLLKSANLQLQNPLTDEELGKLRPLVDAFPNA